ncbi:MAG: DUF3786 domain-containing protein [Oscillospiraceae bacterium]|nr:DUF3786 domain-containing protein [Oscillospiraceae bacterium]
MKQAELLERLRQAVSPEEWAALEKNSSLPVSPFNRKVLLEMRDASAPDGEIPVERAAGLYETLQAFYAECMAEQTAGQKYVTLACFYLTFVAGRPMHPIEQLDIKATETGDGIVYECPEKSTLKKTVCDYCVCKRMSNYEITKRQMARAFAQYDQEKMAQKFHLDGDKDYLYIRCLNRTYQIRRTDGTVTWEENGIVREAGFNETMTFYDLLCNAKDGCSLSGEFTAIGNLVNAANNPGSGGSLTARQTRLFDHRETELSRACEQLGGVPCGKGDVAYRLPLFDFMPVILQFWNSDDEFPASLQVLWDKNTTDFMHFETVWYALGHLLDRLQELLT